MTLKTPADLMSGYCCGTTDRLWYDSRDRCVSVEEDKLISRKTQTTREADLILLSTRSHQLKGQQTTRARQRESQILLRWILRQILRWILKIARDCESATPRGDPPRWKKSSRVTSLHSFLSSTPTQRGSEKLEAPCFLQSLVFFARQAGTWCEDASKNDLKNICSAY